MKPLQIFRFRDKFQPEEQRVNITNGRTKVRPCAEETAAGIVKSILQGAN